jgi:hypothetical protein
VYTANIVREQNPAKPALGEQNPLTTLSSECEGITSRCRSRRTFGEHLADIWRTFGGQWACFGDHARRILFANNVRRVHITLLNCQRLNCHQILDLSWFWQRTSTSRKSDGRVSYIDIVRTHASNRLIIIYAGRRLSQMKPDAICIFIGPSISRGSPIALFFKLIFKNNIYLYYRMLRHYGKNRKWVLF